MIDIFNFWNNLFIQWNDENKFWLCWHFKGVLREDLFNTIKFTNEQIESCCVVGGLFNIKVRKERSTDRCIMSFDLFVGVPSRLDIQVYNENEAHPMEEGKWDKYILPLLECFGCGDIFCETINEETEHNFELINYSAEPLVNFQDYNFDGVRIKYEIYTN